MRSYQREGADRRPRSTSIASRKYEPGRNRPKQPATPDPWRTDRFALEIRATRSHSDDSDCDDPDGRPEDRSTKSLHVALKSGANSDAASVPCIPARRRTLPPNTVRAARREDGFVRPTCRECDRGAKAKAFDAPIRQTFVYARAMHAARACRPKSARLAPFRRARSRATSPVPRGSGHFGRNRPVGFFELFNSRFVDLNLELVRRMLPGCRAARGPPAHRSDRRNGSRP